MRPVAHEPGTIQTGTRATLLPPVFRGVEWGRVGSVAVWLLGSGVLLVLVFAHLDQTPRTWFDEGSHLHVPKALVQTGHYADRSSEGFRAFGPTVGVGPTVMLPIAAVFRAFGIGLLQARLVIATYLLIAVVAFFVLMHRLAGKRVAVIATVLLLSAPGLGFIMAGRQVIGEVPAMVYLLGGLLVWFTRDDLTGEIGLARGVQRCAIAGALFGLTVVTKSQIGILLVPSLVLLALLAWRWDRRIGVMRVLVPLAVMLVVFVVWEGALLTVVTGGSFQENLALLRQASGGSVIVIAPTRMIVGIRFVTGPNGYFALLVPALIYGSVRAVRHQLSVAELTLLIVSITGLVWFVGASIAWPRYAFVPLTLAALPVARLFVDGVNLLRQLRGTRRLLAPLTAFVFASLVAVSLIGQVRTTLSPSDDAPERMAAYLNETVPVSAVIETWEPELGVLTDHNYHYPAPALLDRAVRHQWLGGPPAHDNTVPSDVTYLIVGPFARYTGIYDDAIAMRFQPVTVIGDYALYRQRA